MMVTNYVPAQEIIAAGADSFDWTRLVAVGGCQIYVRPILTSPRYQGRSGERSGDCIVLELLWRWRLTICQMHV